MATDNPSDGKTALGKVVSVELPAPAGWKKKLTPKKGATPGRNDVVFIAPDGVEINSKAHLKRYLKSNPAGVTVNEFDWSTGDTPRRSARLSGKSKESESPDTDTPKKRQRKLSSYEVTKENDDASEDEATSEKDGGKDPVKSGAVGEPVTEEAKAAGEEHETDPKDLKADAEEQEAAAGKQKADAKEQEASAEEQKADAKKPEVAADEQKADAKEHEVAAEEQKADAKEHEVAAEEHKAADEKMDIQLGTNDNEAADMVKEDVQLEPNDGDTEMSKEGNQVSESKQSNGEEGVVEITSLPFATSEEANKAENVPSGAEVVCVTTSPSHEAASTDMFLDAVGDESSTEADAKAEESADKLEVMDQPKYTSDPKVETADANAAHKDSLTKDEAVVKDTPVQGAGEENHDLPS